MPTKRLSAAQRGVHRRRYASRGARATRRVLHGGSRMQKLKQFVMKANALAKKHKILSRGTIELAKRYKGTRRKHLMKAAALSQQMGYGLSLSGNGLKLAGNGRKCAKYCRRKR